ncbi:MAG: DUF1934 domain-containing protein [Bacillota bacterium]
MKKTAEIRCNGNLTGELITNGFVYEKNARTYICYGEEDVSGDAETQTIFKLYPQKAILTRSGEIKSRIIFEQGAQTRAEIETPFGEISIEVYTSKLDIEINEIQVRVNIEYKIIFGEGSEEDNKIELVACIN